MENTIYVYNLKVLKILSQTIKKKVTESGKKLIR